MISTQYIHPFPARMAPEIALDQCKHLMPGSRVLDPMVGSGTVLRIATDSGHVAMGFDLDPLAVLMSKVWTTPVDIDRFVEAGEQAVAAANAIHQSDAELSWIDEETKAFIDFWFAKGQQSDLLKLAVVLKDLEGPAADALRIALSRIIITKDRGASLARDVSHSRPHRVRNTNDFDVKRGFIRSVYEVAKRLRTSPPTLGADVSIGDARNLVEVRDESIDMVITSPPYLNAIDYMRGHKLSLVWLGYSIGSLRNIRRGSVGMTTISSEHKEASVPAWIDACVRRLMDLDQPAGRALSRFVIDLGAVVSEVHRVLRRSGHAVFVVGNSFVRGVYLPNTEVLLDIARSNGLVLLDRHDRALAPSRRYLPPPERTESALLQKRMRMETVLTLSRT